jgi:hypothetical protein
MKITIYGWSTRSLVASFRPCGVRGCLPTAPQAGSLQEQSIPRPWMAFLDTGWCRGSTR